MEQEKRDVLAGGVQETRDLFTKRAKTSAKITSVRKKWEVHTIREGVRVDG